MEVEKRWELSLWIAPTNAEVTNTHEANDALLIIVQNNDRRLRDKRWTTASAFYVTFVVQKYDGFKRARIDDYYGMMMLLMMTITNYIHFNYR